VNAYETLASEVLSAAAKTWGAKVAEKVRVADALDVDRAGLNTEEFTYALMAHFDFLVVQGDEHEVRFAVEFDGPLHETDDDTRRRDALKDAVCEKLGMPLLRVREEHILDSRHEPILAWLVNVWFAAAAFEPITGEHLSYRLTKVESPNAPDRLLTFVPEARRQIFDFLARDAGGARTLETDADGTARFTVTLWFPDVAFHDDPDGTGHARACAYIKLRNGTGVVGEGRCRAVHFPPIRPGDIASELALLEAAETIEMLESGRLPASEARMTAESFEVRQATTATWEAQPLFVPELPI
jgi:hypothetical protein